MFCETDFTQSIKGNFSMLHSVDIPENRKNFMLDIKNEAFDVVVKRYCTIPLMKRIKSKGVRITISVLKKTKFLPIIKKS